MRKEKDGFQRDKVITISVVHFIHDIYTSFLAPALPLIIDKLGMSYGLAGILAVIQRIPSLLNPLVGIIAERPVMRYMVIISPALTAVAMSLIGIAPGYIFLAIILFVSGLSSTLWHIPTPVMIKHYSGSRTGKGMSYYMLGGELARTAGPLIILGVIELWGLEGTWKMMPLGIAASFVLHLQFRKANLSPSQRSKNEGSYWLIFKKFLPAFILTGGYTFFLFAPISIMLAVVQDLNTGKKTFVNAIYMTLNFFVSALVIPMVGLLTDKYGFGTSFLIFNLLAFGAVGIVIYSKNSLSRLSDK